MEQEDTGYIGNLRNKIGTGIRGLLGSPNANEKTDNPIGKFGRLIQPDKIVRNGNTFLTNTRLQNNMTPNELQQYVGENLIPSKDPNDRHFYMLKNVHTGEIKAGTDKTGVENRYAKDPLFASNWETLYDQPLKNAEKLENTIHGNIGMQDTQSLPYGSPLKKLLSGNTEIYKSKNPLFGNIQDTAVKILDKKQLALSNELMGNVLQMEAKYGKGFNVSKEIKKTPDIKNEENLIVDENFARKSKQMLDALGKDTSGLTWKQISEEGVRVASNYNWNLVNTGVKAVQVSKMKPEDAKAFQDVIDMYDKTDVNTNQVLRGLKGVITDPTTAIGAGTLGLGTVAGLGAKQAIKQAVKLGAIEGGAYVGLDDAIRQSVELNAGKQEDFDFGRLAKSTGLGVAAGGVLGGTIQGIVSHYASKAEMKPKDKAIAEKLTGWEEATPEVKTEMLKKLSKNEESHLANYVKEQQTKEQRSTQESVKPASVVETATEKPIQEVKPRTNISKESKGTGQKVKESEGMQKMGAVEFDVVRATEPAEATVTKRPYVTNVQTGKTQGRVYYEKQGLAKDISNKTKFKTREPEEITDAESHVNRKLKMFDDDVEVRKAYGSPEAKFKKEDTTTPEQYQADRLQYEKDLYKNLIKTKTGEVQEQAKQKLKELRTKKVTTEIFSEEDIAKAQETVEKQIGITKEKPDVKVERQVEESRIYEHFKANDKDYQEGFGFAKKEIPDAEIYKNILNDAIERKSEVSQAKARIDKLESLGNKPNPNDEYIVKQQAELRSDIASFKNKEIDVDELRFREMRRLEDRIKKNKDSKFEDRIQILEQEAKRVEEYRRLGIKKTGRAIVGDEPLGTGEYKPKEYSKKDDKSRIFTESVADKYKETNRVNRTKQGELTLREDQINLLDEGITPEQLGRMASSDEEIKAIAKKEVTEQINKARRESIGISKNMEPKGHYVFKDEMADATAQSVQIKALLLGNKRLAEGSSLMKPVSKDMIESGGDFRNLVAKEMKLDKSITSKIEKKTGESWGKPHIKVMSTPSGYGQGLEGRTRKLIEEFGLTKEEASTVAKEYERVMNNIFPEDALLNKIFKQLEQQGTGEFKWTLPSGNESRISVKGTATGKIGKDKVEITINKPDKAFRGLLAGVVQSIDGYIATTIAKRLDIPLTTVHDAFRTKAGNFDKIMNEYNKISTEILDSDLLHNIMKELGYKGESLKNMSEALTKEEVLSGTKKLSPEHTEGELIPVLKRELDDSKIKTENELMRDFMASMDYRTDRTSSMLDNMVDDQMYSDIITKPSDSPFENAIYHALQDSVFKKEMHMEVPDGVNKRLFQKVEKELFAEARMKLEYNPLLRNEVKGVRKYFDENGKPIGRNIQTVNEILRAETKLAESKGIDKFQQRKEKVFKWKENKVLTKKEYIEKKAVMDTVLEVGSPKLKYKTTWNMQNSDAEIYKKTRELQTVRDFAKSTVDRNAESLNRVLEKIEPNKLKEIETLIKSDYEPIMGITKEQVNKIKKEALKLPKGINRHIEASAKGLWSEANQYGYYARNATELARRFNLDESSIPLLDQLISIKAMDLNDGWKIVEKLKDDKDLDFVLKAMKHKRVISEKDIFISNPEKIIKGYQKEVYRGQKELSEAGNVQYKTGPQYEKGLLGEELENKKIGTLYKNLPKRNYEIKLEDLELSEKEKNLVKKFERMKASDEKNAENPDYKGQLTLRRKKYLEGLREKGEKNFPLFNKPQDKFDWMQKNRLRETNGTFRKVTGEDIRKELGKVYDLRESFVETMRATEQKIANKEITMYVMIESDKGSLLFSKEAKEGFIALNKEQMNHLPYEMRDSVKFVNKELFEPIMGREEIRMYNGTNRSLQMIDRLANNFAVLFKQDNVLKNPASYLNSFIVNQTLPIAMGINTVKHVKHQADGLKFLKEMNEVTDKLYAQKVTGQKLDAILEKRLKDNPLYQMEKKGLSTNRVEGTLGDEDLLGAILKDKIPSMVYSLARHLNLSQKTPVGKMTIRQFSKIDTTGRYAMVASLMDKGLTMEKAILESNGLYSNMDEMAVSIVELLDKYPLVPFIKWFSKTSPKLLQVTKNNPVKSVMTAIGLYILAQELGRNLSTTNPLEAMIDFAEGQTPFATYEKIEATGMGDVLMKSLKSHTIPKYLVNAWESPKTLGGEKLLKRRIEYEPYKGFVQSTIEKKGEE